MSFFATLKSLFGIKEKEVTVGPGDRLLQCEDCHRDFVFDAGEQRFFKIKGFTDPKRCPTCRKKVKFRLQGGRRHRHSKNHNRHRGNFSSDRHSPYADE